MRDRGLGRVGGGGEEGWWTMDNGRWAMGGEATFNSQHSTFNIQVLGCGGLAFRRRLDKVCDRLVAPLLEEDA